VKKLAKSDNFETDGEIVDKIPGGKFKVKLQNDVEITCTVSGKIRLSGIRMVVGDKVKVTISPYDFNNGIIVWRK
jgi:translation initiation factor IF-1